MSKRGRRLRLREDEEKNIQERRGVEKEGSTHRPFDPFYRNCTFELATLPEQLARTYRPDTIEHLGITRHQISIGTGHLHQPVIRESNGTQLAVEALLRGKDRQIITLESPSSEPISSLAPLTRENQVTDPDFVPPFKKGDWKVVDFNEID